MVRQLHERQALASRWIACRAHSDWGCLGDLAGCEARDVIVQNLVAVTATAAECGLAGLAMEVSPDTEWGSVLTLLSSGAGQVLVSFDITPEVRQGRGDERLIGRAQARSR